MAPDTSPTPRTLGQYLAGCLARLSQLVTGFPQWENGKRGENGPLCICFCRIGWVGAGPLGRGQPLHLSPAPASRLSCVGNNSGSLSSFRMVSNFPTPKLVPLKSVFFPKKGQAWLGLAFPLLLQFRTKSNSKRNEDPNDNLGGKSMSLKVNGNTLDCYPALWI